MLSPTFLRTKFEAALRYDDYAATATPQQRDNWRAAEGRIALTPAQRSLLAGFTRPMPVLVTSGTWCGDCVAQVPMLRAIEQANPGVIALRILDRDEHIDLSEQIQICGGLRVPTVIFLNEAFDFVGLLGDRTLARYRALAAKQLGGACPLPGAPIPADEIAATLQDWIDEFERVQLLLRLSPKLRQLHGD
ncbi:MAG TPA: thioredoxin family protein [Phycisphaerales bacterium]|nr:thioredoxin family protein [Phycisphaerales bacterium]